MEQLLCIKAWMTVEMKISLKTEEREGSSSFIFPATWHTTYHYIGFIVFSPV